MIEKLDEKAVVKALCEMHQTLLSMRQSGVCVVHGADLSRWSELVLDAATALDTNRRAQPAPAAGEAVVVEALIDGLRPFSSDPAVMNAINYLHGGNARQSVISALSAPIAREANQLCEDCPPHGYPTDATRCAPCPRRASTVQWHPGDEAPQIKAGTERHFIVAVKRAHSGKTYSFPALYLHDYALRYDDGYECVCKDESRHTEEGCPTTGWHSAEANDDGDGQRYNRLSLDPGDELLSWTEVPQFAALSVPAEGGGGFTYFECPVCEFSSVLRNADAGGPNYCPMCDGDNGRDVHLNSRPALATDKAEGRDDRTIPHEAT